MQHRVRYVAIVRNRVSVSWKLGYKRSSSSRERCTGQVRSSAFHGAHQEHDVRVHSGVSARAPPIVCGRVAQDLPAVVVNKAKQSWSQQIMDTFAAGLDVDSENKRADAFVRMRISNPGSVCAKEIVMQYHGVLALDKDMLYLQA
jgi:hypothetical protein